MGSEIFSSLLRHIPHALFYGKILTNAEAVVSDFEITGYSKAFEQFSVLPASRLVGKKLMSVLPRHLRDETLNLLGFAAELNAGEEKEVQKFCHMLNKVQVIRVVCPLQGYAAFIFSDIVDPAPTAIEQPPEKYYDTLSCIVSSPHYTDGNIYDFISLLTEKAAEVLDVSRTSVWLFDEDGDKLRCFDNFDAINRIHSSGAILNRSQYFEEFNYLEIYRYIDAHDVLTDYRLKGYLETYLKPLGINSLLDAGIKSHGQTTGVFCVEHTGDIRVWSLDEINFACQLADQVAIAMSVFHKKIAQSKLAESEEKLKSVFRSAPVGIGLLSNRRFLEVNESFCRITGYQPADLLGCNTRMMYFTEEEYIAIGKKILEGIKQTGTGTLETRWKSKDGKEIFVLLSSSPLDPDDYSKGFSFTAVEITERIHAEEKLRKQYDMQKLLAQVSAALLGGEGKGSLDDSINKSLELMGRFFMADRSYIFLFSNDYIKFSNTHEWCAPGIESQLHRIQNASVKDFGWGLEKYLRGEMVHLEDLDTLPPEAGMFKKELEQQQVKSLLAVPLMMPDRVLGFVGFDVVKEKIKWTPEQLAFLSFPAEQFANAIARHRTEKKLKQSESRYQSVVNTQQEMICRFLPDTTITFTNEAYRRLFKRSHYELLGEKFINFLPDERHEKIHQHLAKFTPQSPVHSYEVEASLSDGTRQWQQWTDVAIFDADGKIMEFQSSGQDITDRIERLRLEQELVLAQKSVEFKKNFLANMSHEMRTPLTGIVGIIEVLEKSTLDTSQQEYLEILKHSSENLRDVINQVLDFSKIEAGKVRLKLKVFPLFDLIHSSKNYFTAIAGNSIRFTTTLDKNLPQYIKADESRLCQVLNNLISNAVKFTVKGKINVKAEPVPHTVQNGKRLFKITVTDTGHGIAKEKLNKLFMPFSQIDERDIRKYEGTGLGLAISKELVALHGGEIGVESIPGKGSSFWFTFLAEPFDEGELRESGALAPENTKGLRILLVEDKKVNQKVISLMLASMGHEVTIANNGREALELFKPDTFDLILMDIQMPEMDGVMATKQLKSKYSSLPPIVGLSANAFEGDKEKYMALGMDDYLTKPVKGKDFANLIEKWF